jgi:tetratricopeptide (TPR) repeat protein
LDPNSAQTHHWYASTLQCRLEGAESLKQIDEALRLNPASPAIATDAAWFHALFGDSDSEIAALKEMDATQPNLSLPSQFLQNFDFFRGDFPAYVAEVRHYASITRRPDDLALADAIERGWNLGGQRGLLEAMAKAQLIAYQHGSDNGFYLGESLVLLGRRAEALPYFRAALKQRTIPLISMEQSPWAKSLAHDPGYASLFADIRKRVHGDIAHPPVAPVFLRLPE